MRRQLLCLVIILVVVAACRREQPQAELAPPRTKVPPATKGQPQDLSKAKVNTVITPSRAFLDRSLLGSKVGADGTVSEAQSKFKAGERVQLTIWLRESPEGLQMMARWIDDKGKIVSEQKQQMKGAKIANFVPDKKLPPGAYRVEGYWGGNYACEYAFRIEK